MHWFTHRTRLFVPRRILPGHGTKPLHAGDNVPLPGSQSPSRTTRRQTWAQHHTRRFDRAELTGRMGLAVSVAVMALVTLTAVFTPSDVLGRSQKARIKAAAAAQLPGAQPAAQEAQPIVPNADADPQA